MNNLKYNNKGFSLVELIIVIAILAILSSVVAMGIVRYIDKSRISKQEQDVNTIYSSLNAEIISFFLSEDNQDVNGALFYGCEGNNIYTDSVTGETCGLITNVTLRQADNGAYDNDNSPAGRLLKRINDSLGGDISYAADSPVNANVTGSTSVYIMVIYNHSGVIRIEYAERGNYTVIDKNGMDTKSIKNYDGLKFSNVY